MGLLNPTPGECVDRQTILDLKMKAADTGEASMSVVGQKVTATDGDSQWEGAINKTVMHGASKVDIQPWLWEHRELQAYLEREWFPKIDPEAGSQFDELMDKLAETNAALWKLEDEARTLLVATKTPAVTYRAAVVMFEITQMNDARIQLTREIDKLFGVNTPGKIYAGV